MSALCMVTLRYFDERNTDSPLVEEVRRAADPLAVFQQVQGQAPDGVTGYRCGEFLSFKGSPTASQAMAKLFAAAAR